MFTEDELRQLLDAVVIARGVESENLLSSIDNKDDEGFSIAQDAIGDYINLEHKLLGFLGRG